MLALLQIHRIWYKRHLYPTLKTSQHSDIKIITFNDLRLFCQLVGRHGGPTQRPGSWTRGVFYADNIMENLNYWSTGYVDWNMALNPEGGGPMDIPDGLEAPVVVDAEKDKFFKNTIFYILGHFSKFISYCSVRIQTLTEVTDPHLANLVQHMAMKNPDGSVSVNLLTTISAADLPCAKRQTVDGYVCICNATYCDTIERPSPVATGGYIMYSTSSSSPGFSSLPGHFSIHTDPTSSMTILVNSSVTFQTMKGIGGAFTDSFCMNLKNLSNAAQENLLKSYFSASGIEYTMGRVPIAGCDCSPDVYTYDDYNYDEDLSEFNLTFYDYNFRIPVIKRAMEHSSRGITLFASAWSGPVWMKDNNAISPGYLLPKYYQLWADYMIKFLDEYKKNGIKFWAVTTGNEPVSPMFWSIYIINNMLALPQLHRIWYKKHLYPTLKKSQHSDVKIITYDDLRPFVSWWVDRIMSDKDVADTIDGIGLHGYEDLNASSEMLDILQEKYKNKFIINTEFCFLRKVDGGQIQRPGSWTRGAYYAYNIMDNLNHWSTGYLDWNMALNLKGGPMTTEDGLEAPVVVNAEKDEFLKNPIFYILGHFSKFISNGSVKIQTLTEDVTSDSANLVQHLAMKNPDGSVSVHLLNQADVNLSLTIRDSVRGEVHFTAEANSINTLVYW